MEKEGNFKGHLGELGNRGADTRVGKALETPPPLAVFNIYPLFQTCISQEHINHTYSGTILPSFLHNFQQGWLNSSLTSLLTVFNIYPRFQT